MSATHAATSQQPDPSQLLVQLGTGYFATSALDEKLGEQVIAGIDIDNTGAVLGTIGLQGGMPERIGRGPVGFIQRRQYRDIFVGDRVPEFIFERIGEIQQTGTNVHCVAGR